MGRLAVGKGLSVVYAVHVFQPIQRILLDARAHQLSDNTSRVRVAQNTFQQVVSNFICGMKEPLSPEQRSTASCRAEGVTTIRVWPVCASDMSWQHAGPMRGPHPQSQQREWVGEGRPTQGYVLLYQLPLSAPAH